MKVLLKRFHLNGHSTGPKSQNYDITGGLKRPRTSDSSGKENLSQEAPIFLRRFICLFGGGRLFQSGSYSRKFDG